MAKQQSLLPLILLLIFISVGAAIGYVVWSIATDIATKASQQMEAKHIKLGKDGVRIEIKELIEEDYVADTQRYEELSFPSGLATEYENISDRKGEKIETYAKIRARDLTARADSMDMTTMHRWHGILFCVHKLESSPLLTLYLLSSLLVKAWNYSSWPAYKSRIWNKQPAAPVLEHRHSSVSGMSSGYART